MHLLRGLPLSKKQSRSLWQPTCSHWCRMHALKIGHSSFTSQPARHSRPTEAAPPVQSASLAHCAHLPAKQRSTPEPPQSRSLLHSTLATHTESSQIRLHVHRLAYRLQSPCAPSSQPSSSSWH